MSALQCVLRTTKAIRCLAFGTTSQSREIADLVDSRHDKVKQSIERLSERGVIVQPPLVDEHGEEAMGRLRITQVYVFS